MIKTKLSYTLLYH